MDYDKAHRNRSHHEHHRHRRQDERQYHHAEAEEVLHRNMNLASKDPPNERLRSPHYPDLLEMLPREDMPNDYVQSWLSHLAEDIPRAQRSPIAHAGYTTGRQPREYAAHNFKLFDRNDSIMDPENSGRRGQPRRCRHHTSSDSSLVQPVYAQPKSPKNQPTLPPRETEHKDNHHKLSLKENKKRKHSDPFSSSDNSSSGSEDPRRKETFEKRKRHKTKADRYEAKNKTKDIAEEEKIIKKKPKKVKRGDAAKASRRAGEDLIRSFTSKNIAQARLTMRPGAGIFRNGRASSPSRTRGLPDLAFSEMRFLKQPTHRPPSSEKEVIISKSAQKSKRERERARNEISNYFAPNRQPLRNIGTNQGRRESSALASDAGRSIVGSHIVLRKSYSQIGSPQWPRHQSKVHCLGFGTGLSSPQKLTLPKPQHDQIFVPRQMAKTASVTSSKPTSYVSWTETAQSGREHGRGTVSKDIHQDGAQSRCKQDEITVSEAAHRDQTRSSSPAELQRMLIESGIFKGMKIQAKLYPEREPGAQQRMKSPELHDDNAQPPMLPVPTSVETPSFTADANRPRPITKHDEERQHLLEAGRAALDDSERLDHNPQTTDIHSPNGADGLHNDVASETSPKQQEAAEHNIIHHYDEQRDWHAADEPTQAIPARPVSVVHRRIPEPIAMMEEIWTRQVRGQALYEGGEEHLYIPEVQRHEIVYGGEEDRRDQGSWDHFAETQTMQRIDEEMAVDEEIYDDVYEQQLFELEQDAADAYYDDAVGGEGEYIEQSGLEQGYWLDDRTVGMEGGERYLTRFREGGTYFGRGGQHEHSLQRPSLQDLVPEEEQLRGFWRPQRY